MCCAWALRPTDMGPTGPSWRTSDSTALCVLIEEKFLPPSPPYNLEPRFWEHLHAFFCFMRLKSLKKRWRKSYPRCLLTIKNSQGQNTVEQINLVVVKYDSCGWLKRGRAKHIHLNMRSLILFSQFLWQMSRSHLINCTCLTTAAELQGLDREFNVVPQKVCHFISNGKCEVRFSSQEAV